MHSLVLSTGSNLGDRIWFLQSASALIEKRVGKIIRISGIYSSEAWGYRSENYYYNQCILVSTDLGAEECLGILLGVEQHLGRTRKAGLYSDRVIDIDILFYDNLVLDSASLKIPHDKMAERRFVLLPLNEILPDFIHPLKGKTISELLAVCLDKSEVFQLHEKD